MVEFFFQLSRLQKLYKIENIPKFQLPKWGRLLVSFHRRLIPAAQIQWCDVLDSGSDRKWVLFNQLLGFLTVLLKISKKITQNNCILMAAKWIICHKVNDDLFLPFAKCLQTVRLLPLLFSDIDLFHLEEKRGAERQRGLEKRGNDTNHMEININMSKTSRAG